MATKPEKKGILTLLDHGSALKIPAFQRSFAWDLEQVNDYWDDLKRALDRDGGPGEYFLGLIVLDEGSQIQDGQQRLATTLLFANAIFDAAEAARAVGNHTSALAKNVLGFVTPALRTSPDAPLSLSPADQAILLQRAGIRTDSSESAKRLGKVRKRLTALLEDEMEDLATPDERLRRLRNWGEFLRGPAYVVLLTVPPRDAHNIFETLNTRGVRLSNGDLVKSHLIARVSDTDTAAAVARWNDITGALKDERGAYEKDLESFLLHYYGSRYGHTVKRDLFTDYREQIASDDPLTLLEELYNNAVLYRALVDPAATDAYWVTIGVGTRQAIELINGLGLRQLRYLLLAVLRDFAPGLSDPKRRKRQAEAILKIASWSVRGLVLRSLGTSEAEAAYIGAAERIRTGAISTVSKLKDWFIAGGILTVDDALFRDAFRGYEWDSKSSHTKARAVLYALEYHKIPQKSALTARSTLSVEHVLPQSPAADGGWNSFSADERSVYTYMLGNLLLIDGPSRANDSLGNKTWPQKKQLIQGYGPQTPLTSDALSRQSWTKTTISSRQEELASHAVAAFAV